MAVKRLYVAVRRLYVVVRRPYKPIRRLYVIARRPYVAVRSLYVTDETSSTSRSSSTATFSMLQKTNFNYSKQYVQ